jgi:hypothetical protein
MSMNSKNRELTEGELDAVSAGLSGIDALNGETEGRVTTTNNSSTRDSKASQGVVVHYGWNLPLHNRGA